jgi:hypothetical protein
MAFTDSKGRTLAYGEFFPCNFLPFAYDETTAQEYAPKTKEEAIASGYRWREVDVKNYATTIEGSSLPEMIGEVGEEILKEVIACEHQGRCSHQCTVAFRIIADELQFYRAHSLPLPTLCPNCRHYARLAQRTPLRLWKRKCGCGGGQSEDGSYQNATAHFHGTSACSNEFETSYAPDRPEIVYCLQCYNSEVV